MTEINKSLKTTLLSLACPGSDTTAAVFARETLRLQVENDGLQAEVERLREEVDGPGSLAQRARDECMAYADEQKARAETAEARVAELEAENEDLKYEIVGMLETFAAVNHIETSMATICKNKGWKHLVKRFELRDATEEDNE